MSVGDTSWSVVEGRLATKMLQDIRVVGCLCALSEIYTEFKTSLQRTRPENLVLRLPGINTLNRKTKAAPVRLKMLAQRTPCTINAKSLYVVRYFERTLKITEWFHSR